MMTMIVYFNFAQSISFFYDFILSPKQRKNKDRSYKIYQVIHVKDVLRSQRIRRKCSILNRESKLFNSVRKWQRTSGGKRYKLEEKK